jgi:DNA-binding XRE family transcriptional regulator
MPEIDTYVTRLLAAVASCGMAQTELALKTRLHVNTIRKIGGDRWNPSLDTLRRLDRSCCRRPRIARRVAGVVRKHTFQCGRRKR